MATFETIRGAGVGGGGGSSFLVAEVTLTDVEIKALPTTYIEIIPTPGANKAINVISAFVHIDLNAGAYTNLDADNGVLLAYGDWNADCTTIFQMPVGTGDATFNLGQAANIDGRVAWDGYLKGINSTDYAINGAVKIVASNGGSGDFTGGNAANTMNITVYYTEVTI